MKFQEILFVVDFTKYSVSRNQAVLLAIHEGADRIHDAEQFVGQSLFQ